MDRITTTLYSFGKYYYSTLLRLSCHLASYNCTKLQTVVNILFQFLISDFLKVVKNVKLEVRPLILPHLVKLTNKIEPGVTKLNWISKDWQQFVDKANESITNFKILVKT